MTASTRASRRSSSRRSSARRPPRPRTRHSFTSSRWTMPMGFFWARSLSTQAIGGGC
jgi:hypothetical protein